MQDAFSIRPRSNETSQFMSLWFGLWPHDDIHSPKDPWNLRLVVEGEVYERDGQYHHLSDMSVGQSFAHG